MLWYLPWSENIKKRACRYLLQRYLGNFLEEKLTLDQLSVDLYNGTGTVCDVSLDCEALNELGDAQSWPLEIVDGYMQEITVTIPWSTILKDDSLVEVNGLSLTVQPKVRSEPVSSMLESMWSSMSSSMQLAADCLRQEDGPPDDANPVEGIEMFAHAIDSILCRVKVRFVNTKIRLEHVPKNSEKGIALEIHIKLIEYYDEAGAEPPPEVTDPDKSKTYIISTYTNKRILFEGVTLYTDEFPSKLRTMARSLVMEKSTSSQAEKSENGIDDLNFQSATSELFYETKSVSEIETVPEPVQKREVTPEERANQPDPILFAKLTGKQELGLKIKNTAEAYGPKVDLQLTLGSLIVFMTPRQLHTITELADGINQPHLEDNSNIPLRSGMNLQCKPMKQADFQLIEAQLFGNLTRETRSNIQMYGWTGHSFDDSDAETDRFQPMTAGSGMGESCSSMASSVNTSMSASVTLPSTNPRTHRNKKVPQIDGDPTAEVSHINIKFASCSCILLHKDILVTVPLGVECVTPSSAKKMQETAEDFFRRLGLFSVLRTEKNNFQDVNEHFDQIINRSHLRLITSALSLEGSEKTTSHGSQTNCEVTINHALIRECLYNGAQEAFTHSPDSYDIVKFQTKDVAEDECESSPSLSPDVRINLKQTLKYVRISGEKKLLYPTTDLYIKCMPVTLDVDLTLLDRMSSTIYGRSSRNTTVAPHTVTVQNQSNFTMQCDTMDVVLRFPIADLRVTPYSGLRRVRSDFLRGTFTDLQLAVNTPPSSRPLPGRYTARATNIDLYYHETENTPGIHIARASMSEPFDSNVFKGATAALPTISLTFKPTTSSPGLFDPFNDAEMPFEPAANPMTTSMYLMDKLRPDSQPNPFSSKKTAHQSVAQHEGAPQGQAEELIVPGNEEEMSEFTNHCTENSSIHLDLNLPILSLQLESKQLYEILYNRINSDLLLWEPIGDQYEISPHLTDARIHPPFSMCNNHHYDSDSASSSSDDENLYYSTYDGKPRSRPAVNKQTVSSERHNFCFTLVVDKGLLSINTPVRDSNKRVVPGQMGELCIEARSLSMCLVSGLNGRAKTAQLALRAHNATMYHDGLITIPTEKSPLRTYGTSLPMNLRQTIYPSGKGVKLKAKEQNRRDMLTLALSVEPQMDLPNFKRITVSLGLSGATYRHLGERGVGWVSQLLDVLDVADYPVPGYTPPTVLTHLHVHIADAAVDYRPLYLPIRSVITLGSFSVSSNVIAQTNTTSLRFLAQECALHLSHITCNTSPNSPVPLDEGKHPELVRDYVKVVELGLFELSLRMAEKSRRSGPWMDVSVSNDVVRVSTCWDSATALGTLVGYLADHGDHPADHGDRLHATPHRGSLTTDEPDPLLGLDGRPEDIRELSQSEIQQVNDMMAEAMKESPNTTLDDDDINSSTEKEGVEIFFFPDESNMTKRKSNTEFEITENKHFDDEIVKENIEETANVEETNEPSQNLLVCSMDHFDLGIEAKPTNAQVVKELGDPTSTTKETPKKPKRNKKNNNNGGGSTDEEYCIVDCDTQCDDELAEPTVRWIVADVPAMCDNHFTVPAAKSDVLKAPKNFPTPTVRYTLCEMSVIWVVYGGHDFQINSPLDTSTPNTPNRKVTIADPQHSPKTSRVSLEYEPYSSGRAVYRSTPRSAPRPLSRDNDTAVHISLHKVKFQHETYPSGGTYAARQTLAVGKIEVLDRLANSHINKFLSQYALNDEPERKNAHMLVVKAVHLRPDPTMSAQECCLKVSLLPLRFNIDQDTLAFLVGFFAKLGSDEPESDSKSTAGRSDTPPRAPVMGVTRPNTTSGLFDTSVNSIPGVEDAPLMEKYEAERLVSENLIQLEEDFHKLSDPPTPPVSQLHIDDDVDDSPLYFRRVVFSPEVPIRLDYVGKRVDLSAGPIAGLLMGLGQLNCSELRLKRLYHRNGLLGVERLFRWALQEWLSDIKRHQLPGLLSGIGPMHSLLQFVTGIRDLIWLPVEQWRRDGRVVHGLRRGAASFTARTAVAALDITTRILQLIQATAEGAFDMLTPTPALNAGTAVRAARDRRRRRRAESHPSDIRDGVATAYHTVKEGIAESVSLVSGGSGSGGGGVGGVVRAGLSPVAAAAGAGALILGGLRAHLTTDHTDVDKWRITEATSE